MCYLVNELQDITALAHSGGKKLPYTQEGYAAIRICKTAYAINLPFCNIVMIYTVVYQYLNTFLNYI